MRDVGHSEERSHGFRAIQFSSVLNFISKKVMVSFSSMCLSFCPTLLILIHNEVICWD